MKATKVKTFEALACGLVDNGITTLFGLIGDANLFMVESYQQQSGTKFVPAVYELSLIHI